MIIIVILPFLLWPNFRVKLSPLTQTQLYQANQLLVLRKPRRSRRESHHLLRGDRAFFQFGEGGHTEAMRGRGLTEVTVRMYVQYFQQSIDQAGILPNPARSQPARKNDVFAAAVRVWDFGLARRVRPSLPASVHSFSTLRLNLELTHGIPSAFRENTVNRH